MDESVAELKAWVSENVPNSRKDDQFLKRFIVGCKRNQDVIKKKVRNHSNLKKKMPHWYTKRDPQCGNMADLLKLGMFLPLPEPDEEGRRIIIIRATINDPHSQPMLDVVKICLMVLDAAIEEDWEIIENGVVVLIDVQGVTMMHALQMNVALIRSAVYLWQDCYPIRIKGMHFINCPMYVNVVLSIFKRFMRDKLKRRVFTHGNDLTQVHEKISPSLLPIEYQGRKGSATELAKHWQNFTNARRDWFLAQE